MQTPTSLPGSVSVSQATSPDDRKRIYRFRYQVLAEERAGAADKSSAPDGIHHAPVDDGSTILYLQSEKEILGTVRVAFGDGENLPKVLCEAYGLKRFREFAGERMSFTSRLVVAEKWRATPALPVLLAAAYKLCRSQDVIFDFSHCRPSQLAAFQRLGYRRCGPNYVGKHGLEVPLVLPLTDAAHLQQVRSPLARLATAYENDGSAAAWFKQIYPDAETDIDRAAMNEESFWTYLSQRLHEPPLLGVPLLRDLTFDEAKAMVASGTVMQCEAGEPVIRAGDTANEMFVLLSGVVEVRAGGIADKVVATFDRGELFGEVAFLSRVHRSASVVALTDIEVLVLTQDFLRRIMDKFPKVASKVLFNLSIILCNRLVRTTEAIAGTDELPRETGD